MSIILNTYVPLSVCTILNTRNGYRKVTYRPSCDECEIAEFSWTTLNSFWWNSIKKVRCFKLINCSNHQSFFSQLWEFFTLLWFFSQLWVFSPTMSFFFLTFPLVKNQQRLTGFRCLKTHSFCACNVHVMWSQELLGWSSLNLVCA